MTHMAFSYFQPRSSTPKFWLELLSVLTSSQTSLPTFRYLMKVRMLHFLNKL